jgi:hypothetical protein
MLFDQTVQEIADRGVLLQLNLVLSFARDLSQSSKIPDAYFQFDLSLEHLLGGIISRRGR